MAAEKAVGAKTDIGSVNLDIMNARLTILDVQVGNKNDVMKNIVQFDKLELNFNLAEALRGNLELSGIAFGTARETSCELPDVPAQETKKEVEESPFMVSLKAKSFDAMENLKTQATDMLGGTDVESIVKNLESQLQTPKLAKSAITQTTGLVEKWKEKPVEIKSVMEEYADTVKKLQSIDVESISDPVVLKETLTTINDVINRTKALKEKALAYKNEIVADGNGVRDLSEAVVNAVKADKELAENKLATAINAVKNARQILTNALDSVSYSILGKYYPYAKQAVDMAEKLKADSRVQAAKSYAETQSEKKKAQQEAQQAAFKRQEGTDIWYTPQKPQILVEKALVSGENFNAVVKQITNDQDKLNVPTTMEGTVNLLGITHVINGVLDIRTKSTAPVLSLNYEGNGFKTLFDGLKIATKSGIPSLDGLASVKLSGSAGNGFLSAIGSVDLNPIKLSSDGFSSEIVTKYYNQALDAIKSMDIGYDLKYLVENGITLELIGDFAEQFTKAFKGIVESLGNEAKEAAFARINKEINDSSNAYVSKAKEFLGIEGDIDVQNTKVADVEAILEKKYDEVQKRIENLAKGKTQEAIKNVLGDNEASKAVNDVLDNVIEKASSDAFGSLKDKLKNR